MTNRPVAARGFVDRRDPATGGLAPGEADFCCSLDTFHACDEKASASFHIVSDKDAYVFPEPLDEIRQQFGAKSV